MDGAAEGAAQRVAEGAKRRRSRGRILWRAFKALMALALLLLCLVAGLTLLYRYVTPPSTLMLLRWASLQEVDRRAVPLSQISPHLPLMVIASEDARFCRHGGVDWDALQSVVERAMDNGPARGASTIAMQTAKNVFLWHGRSYVRKGLEIPLALWLDFAWPKARLIEVYLNVAEWDEGVFGAEAAARRYFAKSAKDLTRREAALLATALPAPRRRNPGKPSAGHRRLAERLAGRAPAHVVSCLAT